ncbi:MAG: response regulator receiver protein, partial [Desulfobulbaceae bacterium]|nr:response regulator receiver protein [Desulfobulbaceae bacterium]
MNPEKILRGKRILIVDDEKDVLEFLVEHLEMCKIDTALDYEEGKKLLESTPYNAAVLDIMGVRGYELLELANRKGIPAL